MTYLESFEVIKFHLENGVNNACIFSSDKGKEDYIEGYLGFTPVDGKFGCKFRHNNQIIYLFNKKSSHTRARGLIFDCCFVMPDSFPDFLASQIGYQVKDFVYLCDGGEYLFDSAADNV